MCSCSGNCNCNIELTVGPKGDPGVDGADGQPFIDVIPATSATLDLTEAQSGGRIMLDRAAGVVVTLPSSPAGGTNFTFEISTSVTSNAYTINTNGAGLDAIEGYLYMKKDATADAIFIASTDTQISMNGTTSGGLIGTTFTLIHDGVSTWDTSGFTRGSGVVITPFS